MRSRCVSSCGRIVMVRGNPTLTTGPARVRAPQHPEMRFVVADADFLPEMAADVRFTPTFSFFQRGVKACAPPAHVHSRSLLTSAVCRWMSSWAQTRGCYATACGCTRTRRAVGDGAQLPAARQTCAGTGLLNTMMPCASVCCRRTCQTCCAAALLSCSAGSLGHALSSRLRTHALCCAVLPLLTPPLPLRPLPRVWCALALRRLP
jgi:hypothetical protein